MANFGEQKRKNKSACNDQMAGKEFFKQALNHHMRGDLSNAEKVYRQALQIGYLNGDLLSNLGVICQQGGRTEEAIHLYQKAIDINPHHLDAYTNLGSIYKTIGSFEQALTYTLKSLELKPDNPTAHMNLGGIYKDLHNLDQALVSTLKSLELQPDNPDALMNLGGIYKDLHNLDQALASILKSLELKPDNPIAYLSLSIIYKELGQFDQALASTLKSLELKPDNPSALITLGGIYKDLGQLDDALVSTLKSLELKPNNNILALNNLTYFLQTVKTKNHKPSTTPIETINNKLSGLKIPGTLHSRIETSTVNNFIKQALGIAKDLDDKIFTSLSQIYCRNDTYKMGCKGYMSFFNSYKAIANKCHHCYKVQLKVESVEELLALSFFFKTLNLSSNNIRKCMVELRAEAQGLYKGLVYCSSIEESKHVKSYITSELKARTDLSPCISIKRGCTEFSNMYKDYGDIGSGVQVHQGKNQPYEWEKLEKDHLKAQKLIKDIPTLLEFNLGELLIIKNWIYYAQEMGDLSAIAKHCNTMWCNDDFKKQVTIKKETILTRGN